MTFVATRRVSSAPQVLPEPGLYRHFKGGEYEVLEVARHSETEELLVIYCSLDDPTTTWVRPLDMFTELVEHAGSKQPRFEYVPRGHSSLFDRLRRASKSALGAQERFGSRRRSSGLLGWRIPG